MNKVGRKGGSWELPDRIILLCYEVEHFFQKEYDKMTGKNRTFIHNSRLGMKKLLFDDDFNEVNLKNFPTKMKRIHKYFLQKIDRNPDADKKDSAKTAKWIQRYLVSLLQKDNTFIQIQPLRLTEVFLLSTPGKEYGERLLQDIRDERINIKDMGELTIAKVIEEKRKELGHQNRYIFHFSLSHLLNSPKIPSWDELNRFFPFYSDVSFQMKRSGRKYSIQEYLLDISKRFQKLKLPIETSFEQEIYDYIPIDLNPIGEKPTATSSDEMSPDVTALRPIPAFYPNEIKVSEKEFNNLDQIIYEMIYRTLSDSDAVIEPIVLEGESGQGKSMLLRNYFFMKNSFQHEIIPHYIQLSTYDDQPITEFLLKEFEDIDWLNNNREAYLNPLQDGRIILLFDGFDEIKGKLQKQFLKHLKTFIKKSQGKNIIIISSRPKHQLPHSYSRYQLCPFSDDKIEKFLHMWDKGPLFNQIKRDPSLKELLRNPFLLMLFTLSNWRIKKDWIVSKSEIIGQCLEEWLRKRDSKLPNEDRHYYKKKIEILGYIALEQTRRNLIRFNENDLESIELFEDWNNFSNEFISDDNIIMHDGSYFQFYHRIFQEYLAAHYLTKNKDRAESLLLGDECLLNEEWWWPIYEMYAGLENPKWLLCRIEENFDEDIYLSNLRLILIMAAQGRLPEKLRKRIFNSVLSLLEKTEVIKGIIHFKFNPGLAGLMYERIIQIGMSFDTSYIVDTFFSREENESDRNTIGNPPMFPRGARWLMLEILMRKQCYPRKIISYLWDHDQTHTFLTRHLMELAKTDDEIFFKLLNLYKQESRALYYYPITHLEYLTVDRFERILEEFHGIAESKWIIEFLHDFRLLTDDIDRPTFNSLQSLVNSDEAIEKLKVIFQYSLDENDETVQYFCISILLKFEHDWVIQAVLEKLRTSSKSYDSILVLIWSFQLVELFPAYLNCIITTALNERFYHYSYYLNAYLCMNGYDHNFVEAFKKLETEKKIKFLSILAKESRFGKVQMKLPKSIRDFLLSSYFSTSRKETKIQLLDIIARIPTNSMYNSMKDYLDYEQSHEGTDDDLLLYILGIILEYDNDIDPLILRTLIFEHHLDIKKRYEEISPNSHATFPLASSILGWLRIDRRLPISEKVNIFLDLIAEGYLQHIDWINPKEHGISWTWKELNFLSENYPSYNDAKGSIAYSILIECSHPSIVEDLLQSDIDVTLKIEYLQDFINFHQRSGIEAEDIIQEKSSEIISNWLENIQSIEELDTAQKYLELCDYFEIHSAAYLESIQSLLLAPHINYRNVAMERLLQSEVVIYDDMKSAIFRDEIHISFSATYLENNFIRLHFNGNRISRLEMKGSFYHSQFHKYQQDSVIDITNGSLHIHQDLPYLSKGIYNIPELIEHLNWEFYSIMTHPYYDTILIRTILYHVLLYRQLQLQIITTHFSDELNDFMSSSNINVAVPYFIDDNFQLTHPGLNYIKAHFAKVWDENPKLRHLLLHYDKYNYSHFEEMMAQSVEDDIIVLLFDFNQYLEDLDEMEFNNYSPHFQLIKDIIEKSENEVVRRKGIELLHSHSNEDVEGLIFHELKHLLLSSKSLQQDHGIMKNNLGVLKTYYTGYYRDAVYGGFIIDMTQQPPPKFTSILSSDEDHRKEIEKHREDVFRKTLQGLLFSIFGNETMNTIVQICKQLGEPLENEIIKATIKNWIGQYGYSHLSHFSENSDLRNFIYQVYQSDNLRLKSLERAPYSSLFHAPQLYEKICQ